MRKESEYRQVEFARRQPVELNRMQTWIVSREDLILSKLLWAQDSDSELQRRDGTMNDTSPTVAAMVAEHYRRMMPHERMEIASDMFETARAIVEASLLPKLTRRERRLAFAKRMYGNDLPETALVAYAEWQASESR